MALSYHFTTTTGAVTANLVAGGAASNWYGVIATSAEAATYYLKLYWEGTGTAAPSIGGVQPTTTLPVPGTNKPHLTIPVPTTGLSSRAADAINMGGRMWYWVTANAADTDTTVLTAGGDVISIIYG
jgi:hypothetical protein